MQCYSIQLEYPIHTYSQSPQAGAELPMLFSKSQLKNLETSLSFSAQTTLFTAQKFGVYSTKKLSEKNPTALPNPQYTLTTIFNL